MPASKNTYRIKEASGGKESTVQGTRYEYDTQSGRHLIYDGDELVANVINVSVTKQS